MANQNLLDCFTQYVSKAEKGSLKRDTHFVSHEVCKTSFFGANAIETQNAWSYMPGHVSFTCKMDGLV